MAKFINLNHPTIKTHTSETVSVTDDLVLCTDNVYTNENVQCILAKNNISPDVNHADWIISQLPLYYTEQDVLSIDALI